MDFFQEQRIITRIVLVCLVKKGYPVGEEVHRNRPSHGLAYRCSGSALYRFSDGQERILRPGEIIYLPQFSTYKVRVLEPGECYAINFEISEEIHASTTIFRPKHPTRLLEHFKNAEHSWINQKSNRTEQCMAELYFLLAQIKEEQHTEYLSQGTRAKILPALTYLREHYTDPTLDVAALAAQSKVSEVYLRRLFHAEVGCSPNQYLRRLRLNRAAELLSSGMYTVRETVELSGFLDDSYFAREFHKCFGVSPNACKNRGRGI